ncbi:hypothetical protein B7494_g65 [Chlorociboria aeruginascens]|nr:hypothetical protein B7494_g65 [Chlorociboria aeruginascens]
MDRLVRLRDSFSYLLTPISKRRRTVGPQTPANHAEHHYQPASEPQDKKAQASFFARVNQKYLSPADTKLSRKRPHEDDDEEAREHDLASSIDPPSSDDESSQVSVEDEVDDEPSSEEKVEEYLARQAELELKRDEVEQAKARGDWHPDEVFLIERLALRGFEALLPAGWQIDFDTLPKVLFETTDNAFINYNCASSYRGTLSPYFPDKTNYLKGVRALKSLTTLANRVKDKERANLPTERLITKEIENYIKWTENDGGYAKKRFIPVITVMAARPKQSLEQLSRAFEGQMKFLAARHREVLALPPGHINELGEVQLYARRPPILYGIIVAQSKIIFFTLDSSNPDANTKHIRHFDLQESNMGIWNGLSIAIILIVARNYIMSIKADLEDDDEPESDPDV